MDVVIDWSTTHFHQSNEVLSKCYEVGTELMDCRKSDIEPQINPGKARTSLVCYTSWKQGEDSVSLKV